VKTGRMLAEGKVSVDKEKKAGGFSAEGGEHYMEGRGRKSSGKGPPNRCRGPKTGFFMDECTNSRQRDWESAQSQKRDVM